MDAGAVAWRSLGEIKDATFALERLRAIKRPDELEQLRIASERVIESMLAVIAGHGPGHTTAELTESLRREETIRGLTFEYCLITAGTSLNRAPSHQKWDKGDILSLDSGGNYHGYIGDLCRMAIQGEPDAELEDMLAEIEEVQRASMKPIKAGAMASVVYGAAEPLVRKSKHHNHMHFLAHGMGLISHEAPRLTASGPVPYDAYDAERPLETGMVISVETTLAHPQRGFIKLEDTVVVTAGRLRHLRRGRPRLEPRRHRGRLSGAPVVNAGSRCARSWPAPQGTVCAVRSGRSDRECNQRDGADACQQHQETDRIVVEPTSALDSHDAPLPTRAVLF